MPILEIESLRGATLRKHETRTRFKSGSRSGFTLGELLIVIAVIAALLALTVPSLSRAKGLGRLTQCKANLRELGLAMRLYVDEHNYYPNFVQWGERELTFWPDLLGNILSERMLAQETSSSRLSVFVCPSFCTPTGGQDLKHITYGYNGVGYAFRGLSGQAYLRSDVFCDRPVSESAVMVPSDAIALGDGIERLRCGILLGAGINLKRWLLSPPEGASLEELKETDRRVRSRHSGRANVVLCDGHVESNPIRVLFEDTSDAALRRWNRDHQPHREWLVK